MVERVKERRGKPRVESNLGAEIRAGEKSIVATVKNMSESGLLLVTDHAVKELTLVGLKLALPPESPHSPRIAFEIQGAIVRCAKIAKSKPARWEVAVFMTGIPQDAKLALHDYIQGRLLHG